jgi:hypothetical protein
MLPEDVVQDEDQPARKAILSLVLCALRRFSWDWLCSSAKAGLNESPSLDIRFNRLKVGWLRQAMPQCPVGQDGNRKRIVRSIMLLVNHYP